MTFAACFCLILGLIVEPPSLSSAIVVVIIIIVIIIIVIIITEELMYFCTVQANTRVKTCTLTSNCLRCFELIRYTGIEAPVSVIIIIIIAITIIVVMII